MYIYALTIFLSACLVFQVQPLMGKYILPWFGGTPAVWSTCLLFFQAMLLVGYAYAHLLARLKSPRKQVLVHVALLAVSCLAIPIIPDDSWREGGLASPSWSILLLLAASVGFPYAMLSTSAPLLQSWFSLSYPRTSPYRLYAVSNLGAILALVTFPTLFEPWVGLNSLVWTWSLAYLGFACLCVVCGASVLWFYAPAPALVGAPAVATSQDHNNGAQEVEDVSRGDLVYWVLLAATGSLLLLATTNQICQDIAPAPFLWILPLLLYLISFVICFDRPQWYRRGVFSILLMVAVPASAVAIARGVELSIGLQVAVLCTMLAVGCMVCHGELANSKPSSRNLTAFYLAIAFGGALGAVFVTLVAPAIFDGYYELYVGIACTCLVLLAAVRRDKLRSASPAAARKSWMRFCQLIVAVAAVIAVAQFAVKRLFDADSAHLLAQVRNFYGVISVSEIDGDSPSRRRVTMVHGTTSHGSQYPAPELRNRPTVYYIEESGIGVALQHHPLREAGRPLRIGGIGLGAGTIAAYAMRGDVMTFYEINPDVIELSQRHFTFQSDALSRGADLKVLRGDARILLEKQRNEGYCQDFDVLAVDAFSSDAIPMHLLTRECFEVYFDHLAEDGVLAVHVSNRYLDLKPVVRAAAQQGGYEAALVTVSGAVGDDHVKKTGSAWVLVTKNEEFLGNPAVQERVTPWESEVDPSFLWTDDYSNLYQVLR